MKPNMEWTSTCVDCGASKFSQDPEPLIAWAESHHRKCPVYEV